VRHALGQLNQARGDSQPALHKEIAAIVDQQSGWKQSLANKDLHSRIREELTAAWTASIEREEEIRAMLAEKEGFRDVLEQSFDTKTIQGRLKRLDQVLTDNAPTLANIELSLHIDHIECFPDGHVVMRTCKLGLLDDICELLVESQEVAPYTSPTLSS
jgi:hypothetical protein